MTIRYPILLVAMVAFTIVTSSVWGDPVRTLPGLTSISFFERTGGNSPIEHIFGPSSSQLTTQLSDPLGNGNNDFIGVPNVEFYDVYYSDADGNFELDGEYLSITGRFDLALPAGGGLNLAEIGLNFAGDPTEFGNFVASFVALGDNAFPSTAGNAIDGDLLTHTTMGNTNNQTERLRVTLGFLSSSGPPPVPEPSSFVLLASGILGICCLRRKRLAEALTRN